jgi:hypothetical protein
MIENNIIFAILLYLIATNRFCKLFVDNYGVFLILKRTTYRSTKTGIKEQEKVKVKTLFKFK